MRHTLDGFTHVLLFAGCIIIVFITILTVQNLNDETAVRILLPGIVMALPLFILAALRQKTRNRPTWKERKLWRVAKTHRR